MDALAKAKLIFQDLAAKPAVKEQALASLEEWLARPELRAYRPYIERLVDTGAGAALLDSFWRMIPFGTGGRRGPVGAGPNRINPHTIALSVQGHCQYLAGRGAGRAGSAVVVAYDVRQFFDLRRVYPGVHGILDGLTSRDMARISAETYAGNGIAVYVVGPLADEPGSSASGGRFISTPELSFLIRELGCAGGLNISASHNHPDDNGGKFYNRHGGQEIPPHDEELLQIVEGVTAVRSSPYREALGQGLIRFVPAELHRRYIELNTALVPTRSRSARVAFTPLSGTGTTTVGEALAALGFEVHTVSEQAAPDGSFSAVRFRIGNPEVPESMDRLTALAAAARCDLGFATDPDADRLGVIAPDGRGGFLPVNGNDIGVLLVESILEAKRKDGTLPKRPIFINTLVTSSLQRKIARRYGCQVVGDLMVGFKYMGDVLSNLELHGRFPPPREAAGRDAAVGTLDDFVFTCEESHGYLLTPRVRDKDACGAAVHLAGLASRLKDEGRTLRDFLRDIFRVYGYHANRLRSLVMEGIVGIERMSAVQQRLRESPPREIGGLEVVRFVDNQVVGGPIRSSTDAASRNVLLFVLDAGAGGRARLVVRPSGTEPKTKIYVEVPSPSPLSGTLGEATAADLASVGDPELDATMIAADAQAVALSDAFIRYCLGPEVLGDVYGEVPAESLLVSDLVPVDHKIRLVREILPEMARRTAAEQGETEIRSWLVEQLRPFGEDPAGLIGAAARAWLARREQEGGITKDTEISGLSLLGLG